jgi:hypothetical protein
MIINTKKDDISNLFLTSSAPDAVIVLALEVKLFFLLFVVAVDEKCSNLLVKERYKNLNN